MQLESEIVVPVSLEQAWELLQDVPRVAPCMPGLELLSTRSDGEATAMMRMQVGPMKLAFDVGLARKSADHIARRVVLDVKAVEQKGRGNADALVSWTLADTDRATRVTIVTDLTLSGRVAQFARGVVEQLASDMTRQFAIALRAQLGENGTTAAAADGPTTAQMPSASPTASVESASTAVATERVVAASPPQPTSSAPPPPARVGRLLLPSIGRAIADFFRRLLRRR